MPKTVNPTRKRLIKRARKQGKSGKECLLAGGLSECTATHHAGQMTVLKRVDAEIKREFDKSKLTVEWVLDNLEQLRIKAETKKDYGTAKGILELIGKWKRMWDEKSITQVNVYSQTPEDK